MKHETPTAKEIKTARRRGDNAGKRDAYNHDNMDGFKETLNPYGMDSEPEMHEAWERARENTFESNKRSVKTKPSPDIYVYTSGISLVCPMTKAGMDWLVGNLNFEPWQFNGGGFACEPNLVDAIATGARDDGLEVA